MLSLSFDSYGWKENGVIVTSTKWISGWINLKNSDVIPYLYMYCTTWNSFYVLVFITSLILMKTSYNFTWKIKFVNYSWSPLEHVFVRCVCLLLKIISSLWRQSMSQPEELFFVNVRCTVLLSFSQGLIAPQFESDHEMKNVTCYLHRSLSDYIGSERCHNDSEADHDPLFKQKMTF